MSLRNQERGLFTVQGLIFTLGLLASFVSVGTIYAGVIRPAISRSTLASSVGLFEEASLPHLFILLNGYEQQVCLSIFLWALMILGYKGFALHFEASAFGHFLPQNQGGGCEPYFTLFDEQTDLGPARARDFANKIASHGEDSRLQNKLLPYVITRGLERYALTGSAQEATETISGRLDVAAEQQESELSLLRYIAWAIPSIGFIGTVRGIGQALERADEALEGDISGVTSALGLAFNSTLVALILSIGLVLFIHLLAAKQEGFIIRLETLCREGLIDRLKGPAGNLTESTAPDNPGGSTPTDGSAPSPSTAVNPTG